jgi:hypothetical protein
MQSIFQKIFHLHHWYNDESISGPGSSLSQTKTLREILPKILSQLKVSSVLDIPCGDFNWIKEIDLSSYSYCGADIVHEIVSSNLSNYSRRNRHFVWADITSSNLVQHDLIFCRDCLVHFSYADVFKAVINIKKSNSQYLLTTTFPGRVNKDIKTGGWRPLDLQNDPFYFPPPIKLINEQCTEEYGRYSDKSLGLWAIENLPGFG